MYKYIKYLVFHKKHPLFFKNIPKLLGVWAMFYCVFSSMISLSSKGGMENE